MESFFIQALVRAGSCRKHARPITDSPARQLKEEGRIAEETAPRSLLHDGARSSGPFNKFGRFAKSELQAMVDYYGIDLDKEIEEEPADEGGLLVWNIGDMHEPYPLPDFAHGKYVKELERLLQDDESSHDDVYETYKKLQAPGVVYLHVDTIRNLLRHMSIVERPTPTALQRYLSILDDMKTAHIHIIESEWTSAVHLAGRATGRVTAEDLHTALQLWRDMEHRARVQGGYVTLNVLFTVAVKAGRTSLAEKFLKELNARNLELHRHFRVSMIYYYGVIQNGNLVRKTYQELVAAGDIVDTVVLNSVIAALIRAGEPVAAEHVFERMKRLHAQKRLPAPGHRFFNRHWRDKRALGLHLTYEGRRLQKLDEKEQLAQLQEYAPIAPDSRTYSLIMRYQARQVGDADRVFELLEEMRYNKVPLDGTIFIVIFHGFSTHGGTRYTSWTAYRLEKIWTKYLISLRDGLERTWLSKMAVISALKAFKQCTDATRTLQAWEELRKLWHPSERELESVLHFLRWLMPSEQNSTTDVAPGKDHMNV